MRNCLSDIQVFTVVTSLSGWVWFLSVAVLFGYDFLGPVVIRRIIEKRAKVENSLPEWPSMRSASRVTQMARFYQLDLSVDPNNPFVRDAEGKLVRRIIG
jgi:hypothetical protein